MCKLCTTCKTNFQTNPSKKKVSKVYGWLTKYDFY